MRKTEKEYNSVMDLEYFTKINQGKFTLDTICDPNIMTLAQVVHKLTWGYNGKNGKGRQFSHGFREFHKKLMRLSTLGYNLRIKYNDPA